MFVSDVLELTDTGSNDIDDIHIIADSDSHLVDDYYYKSKYTHSRPHHNHLSEQDPVLIMFSGMS